MIKKNKDIILYIPRTHLITLEMAKDTSVAKKMIQAKLDLLSPKHSFLSTFLLQVNKIFIILRKKEIQIVFGHLI